jgi:hypothetical protein
MMMIRRRRRKRREEEEEEEDFPRFLGPLGYHSLINTLTLYL